MNEDTPDGESPLARHPYAMVAGAVGLGFVLGGGLFTRLTARIVGAGLRVAAVSMMPLLEKELLGAARRALHVSKLDTEKEGP
jgi:hypothetical protein